MLTFNKKRKQFKNWMDTNKEDIVFMLVFIFSFLLCLFVSLAILGVIFWTIEIFS